jgi:hypothetical protein
MAFLAPLIGAGIGLVANNITNKQNGQAQQNAQDNAQGINAQALQLAQQQQQQALANMFLRYQQYMQTNPNPAQTWQGIKQPAMNGGTMGGGQIGSNGSSMNGMQPPTALTNPVQGQSIAGVQPAQSSANVNYASLSPQQLAQAMQSMQIPQGLSTASTIPGGKQIQAVRGPGIF